MQHPYTDCFELPQELCVKPFALIGVTGLDTLNNAVHKTIWDAFSSNRRADRAPIQFHLLNNAHEFPVQKPKRNSYEWYIPKGILKRNWMKKHLNEIPAVIVLFYDLDWNDLHWNEKLIECSSRVQSMRAAIEGRSTRVVVVLIQQTAPLPAGEDILANERATALCATCELNAKHLFVLPHGDHLHGYTARLENAFYDLAQGYYQLEIRNIKTHRDHLNKTTHQYLFVRHQFKMGFLNELKQDNDIAHKHYTYAYNNLQEIRMVDTNALEIKTIAGYLNYKLCRVMFSLSLPRDAISQFRAHVDRYKMRSGFKELAFEHHAWMSKQFSIFGDLFDEAIRLGLPAVQTQHPGFYYQQAAHHASLRKLSCFELCDENAPYPSPDPLEGINRVEHYGQRPWRPGRLSAEPPDPALERAAIAALQWKERHTVNHSGIIIMLYGNAITQFKTYRCARMRRHLVVQMAEEYYNSHDYGKALTLLTHMLWDYRIEKWFSLLSSLLKRALSCAQLIANIQDYVILSLEAISNSIPLSESEKAKIHENLRKVLKKSTPDIDQNVPLVNIQNAQHLWSTENIKIEPVNVVVEMNNITPCFQVKARFIETKYPVHKNVIIEIYVRSCCSQSVHFSQLSVIINSPNYSSEFNVTEGDTLIGVSNPTLWFQSNEIKKFILHFIPNVEDVGKEIQIGSVMLYLGSPTERQAILKFTGTGSENTTDDTTYTEFQSMRSLPKNVPDFYTIDTRTATKIISRPSQVALNIIHDTPTLLNEWYPIQVDMKNNDTGDVSFLNLDVDLVRDESITDQNIEFRKTLESELDKLPLQIKVSNFIINSSASTKFFIKVKQVGRCTLILKINYNIIDLDKTNCPCIEELQITVDTVDPFHIECQCLSMMMEPVTKCFINENFIITPSIINKSPWSIVIEKINLDLNPILQSIDLSDMQIISQELPSGSQASEMFICAIRKSSASQISLGSLIIHWKRKNSTTPINLKVITLPVMPLEKAAMTFKLSIPSYGVVKTPITAVYHLNNCSSELIQLNMSMEVYDDSFLFAGHKQKQLSVLPNSEYILNFTLYPLVPGNISLPKLILTIPDRTVEEQFSSVTQEHLNELLKRSFPQHIFILPQIKENPKHSVSGSEHVDKVPFDSSSKNDIPLEVPNDSSSGHVVSV